MSDYESNNINATEALTSILSENLKQLKRANRYKAIGRFISIAFFLIITVMIINLSAIQVDGMSDISKPHTAVIDVKGVISEDSMLGSADNVISALQRAYKQDNVKGIILNLNSPGGSPVQSDLIYNEIKRLQAQDKNNRKVYAVVNDMCASGCYYLASAADKIYANELSVVGSIGVLYSNFGAVDLLKKVGVDRRLQTAGKYKAIMDPFSEETEESKQIIDQQLKVVHQVFIERVVAGRKGKIMQNNPDIFSGLFWHAKQAIELGLIDDIKSKSQVAKEVIMAEELIDYTTKPTLGDLLSNNYSKFPMSLKSLQNLESFGLIDYLDTKHSVKSIQGKFALS